MIDVKWAPITGALVVTRSAWDAMSPAGREALQKAAATAGEQIKAYGDKSDTEAIAAMAQRGLQVQTLTPEGEAAWQRLAEQAWPLIRGRTVPAPLFDEARRLVAEYRRGTGRP